MTSTRKWLAITAVTITAGLGLVVGRAFADTSNSTVTGCFDSKTGALRVLTGDSPTCTSSETSLSWNQQQPATRWYRDWDNDGYGDWYRFLDSPAQPLGYVANNSDCDDNKAAVHPGQKADPGPGDINCDGIEANDRLITWYRDADRDGWGNYSVGVRAPQTAQPDGYVYRYGDCDDHNSQVHPYQTKCHRNGDIDGDGHASALAGGDDCNDADGSEFPGNTERTDPYGHDDDCDPTTGGVIQYDPNFLDPRPHPTPGLRYQPFFGPTGHLRDIGAGTEPTGCEITPYSTGLWCTPPLYAN